MEKSTLILDTLTQRQLLALIHNLLSRNSRDTAVARNRRSRLRRNLKQLVLTSIYDLRRNAPLTRFLAAEVLASENQLHRLTLPNRPGKTLRATGAGDNTELDLGLAEGSARGAVDDIAHESELTAATKRVTGDSGDNGLADGIGEVRPRRDEVVAVRGGEGQGPHFFDVGAGGEGLLAACDDDCADVLVAIVLAQCVVQLGEQWAAEGVEGLGSVEGDFEAVG